MTVALRLTLWYAAVFSSSSLLALALLYSAVLGVLRAGTDDELRRDLAETAALVREGGEPAFRAELARELAGPDAARVYLRLWTAAAQPVVAAGYGPPDEALRRMVAVCVTDPGPALHTAHPADRDFAVRTGCLGTGNGYVVEFGQDLEAVEDLLAALRNGIFVVLPTVLLLGVPIGWFMTRRALRGVTVVTRTALEIAAGATGRRVPVGGGGVELDRLAAAFNSMLDRIESLMTGMREVTDNLAHDLRTPLSRIRTAAERAVQRDAAAEDRTVFAETTIEECDRLRLILDSTLEIAEAQAGAASLRLEEVDLAALVAEACELFLPMAEDAGIRLALRTPPRCPVRADRSRVQRIVANLLDNALKYTPAGGRVGVSLTEAGDEIRLEVSDSGIGIAAEDLPKIFERFYRGDGSRSGHGSGLGLSLARAFAQAHGGELTAASAQGQGSVFTLSLRRSALVLACLGLLAAGPARASLSRNAAGAGNMGEAGAVALDASCQRESEEGERIWTFETGIQYEAFDRLQVLLEATLFELLKPVSGRDVRGAGDTELTVSWLALPELDSRPVVVLGVKTKLPTAGDGEFGTGKPDYAGLLILGREFGELELNLETEYASLGAPDGEQGRRRFGYVFTAEYGVGDLVSLYGEAYGSGASSDLEQRTDGLTAGVEFAHPLDDRLEPYLSLEAGTEGAIAIRAGVEWTW